MVHTMRAVKIGNIVCCESAIADRRAFSVMRAVNTDYDCLLRARKSIRASTRRTQVRKRAIASAVTHIFRARDERSGDQRWRLKRRECPVSSQSRCSAARQTLRARGRASALLPLDFQRRTGAGCFAPNRARCLSSAQVTTCASLSRASAACPGRVLSRRPAVRRRVDPARCTGSARGIHRSPAACTARACQAPPLVCSP